MKSKERHELATNELADALARWGHKLRPLFSYILVAIILVVAIIWWAGRQRRAGALAAQRTLAAYSSALVSIKPDLSDALDGRIDAFDQFLADHGDSSLARLAHSVLAGDLLHRAVLKSIQEADRASIDADLDRAAQLYGQLARGNDDVAAMARYGQACVEAERGNVSVAREQFDALKKQYEGLTVADLCEARLTTLAEQSKLVFDEPPPEPAKAPEKQPQQPKPEQSGQPKPEGASGTEPAATPAANGNATPESQEQTTPQAPATETK